VQAGADINAPCGPRGECRTPLHVAAEHGHVDNVQVRIRLDHRTLSQISVFRINGCTVFNLCSIFLCAELRTEL
jgi:hypothetical protein